MLLKDKCTKKNPFATIYQVETASIIPFEHDVFFHLTPVKTEMRLQGRNLSLYLVSCKIYIIRKYVWEGQDGKREERRREKVKKIRIQLHWDGYHEYKILSSVGHVFNGEMGKTLCDSGVVKVCGQGMCHNGGNRNSVNNGT
jgi:hypothetical protein